MFDIHLRRSIVKVFFLSINLDHANLSSSLAPILGQYGIKPSDFTAYLLSDKGGCFYLPDTNIFIRVSLLRSGKYVLRYLTPTVNFVLKQLQFQTTISLLHIFKVILLKSVDVNKLLFNTLNCKKFFDIMVNYFKSFNDKSITIVI